MAPPAADAASEAKDESRLPELRHYRDQLLKFFPRLASAVGQVSAICDQAESKAGAWDATGVDPAAVDFAGKLQVLIDHRQQMAVVMAALVAEQQNEALGGRISDAGLKLLADGSAALFSSTDAAVTTAAGDLQAGGKPTKEYASVERALTEWRRDATAAAGAKNEQ